MTIDKKKFKDTALGGVFNNPVFVLALGMCPTIATSTSIVNAFAMGVSTLFVLVFSNLFISLLRKLIPDKVRLPAYIVIIATFVTVVQMFVKSFLPSLNDSIGPFIALIVVNCIILGRAESFASKHSVGYSVLDGLSIGLGFVVAICLLGGLRQLLILAGISVFGTAAGGFLALGLLMGFFNYFMQYLKDYSRNKRLLLSGGNL